MLDSNWSRMDGVSQCPWKISVPVTAYDKKIIVSMYLKTLNRVTSD